MGNAMNLDSCCKSAARLTNSCHATMCTSAAVNGKRCAGFAVLCCTVMRFGPYSCAYTDIFFTFQGPLEQSKLRLDC